MLETGGGGSFSPSSWTTTANATQRSVGVDNTEAITVSNPSPGYVYISLKGETTCSGVTGATQY
ncbi:hypothetical protein [Nocardia sp. NRRL S-836]|uniref:hypothetical protein n=1 Tax=Nocardia sp. NRRL S-836 TaxID=1519492 RepID=UPI0006ADCE94|nr:hypothetical protein [Nocardia sp. NRRL S-836]KOV83105.1 hypothetical protein ADL03_21240 [Nocardia sp. NRRL S-836]